MLEQLSIAPAALVRANVLSVASIAAAGDALRIAVGADAAAALLDAAQRSAVTSRELEVPFGRLAIGARLGAGSFGTVHVATLEGEQLALALTPPSPSYIPLQVRLTSSWPSSA